MLKEMMIYARGLIDEVKGWDKDFQRNAYLSKARSGINCKGRKKKQNMNHVRRATRLRHRRAR